MKDIISVIIPVYNVEAYLPQCLDSVLAQDYSSLQVIVIDDGSTDGSGAICDEYAARDSRVVVVHQKNGGAAAAKNAGLRIASGKYLSFVDSDDFLEPGAYSYMIGRLNESNADVIRCSFNELYPDREVYHIPDPQNCQMSGKQFLLQYIRGWSCGILWDKLYKRDIFSGIYFEEGHKIDDEYFTYQGIMNAETVLCDTKCVYHYRRRKSSVMLSPASGKQIAIDWVDFTGKRRANVVNRFPDLRKEFDLHFLDAMLFFSRVPNASEESIMLIKQNLKQYVKEKDHTVPNIKLWPALISLYTSKPANLLQKRTATPSPEHSTLYFD